MKVRPSSSSNKWVYGLVLAIAILVLNTGIFVIAYFNLQNRLTDQERQLQDIQQQFDILDYIDETQLLPWPEIYDQIKHSVVLIQTDTGLGSGFVYDSEGHIITNYHVIEDATTVQVTFLDGNITEATVRGEDPYSDLAIVKVYPAVTTLHPVVFGHSTALTVGEPVAAIGNPFGLSDTITSGIISALERDLAAPGGYLIVDVVQVDAAINPGNSGGPLVNLRGQVVGVNTAIVTTTGTFVGVGLAIPSDTVKREIDDLIATGTYKHPWMGIVGRDVDLAVAQEMGLEKPLGFLITNINSSSPAEKAELQIGDVIMGVDDQPVRKLSDLAVYIERNKRPGDQIILDIIRNDQQFEKNLILGERPSIT